MTTEEELRKAAAELEEYDRDVREGRARFNGAERRGLRLRVEMLEERVEFERSEAAKKDLQGVTPRGGRSRPAP
jgi:hypothetical protein